MDVLGVSEKGFTTIFKDILVYFSILSLCVLNQSVFSFVSFLDFTLCLLSNQT